MKLKIRIISICVLLMALLNITAFAAPVAANDIVGYNLINENTYAFDEFASSVYSEANKVIISETSVELDDGSIFTETLCEYIPEGSGISTYSSTAYGTVYLSKTNTHSNNDLTTSVTLYATFNWDREIDLVFRYNEYYEIKNQTYDRVFGDPYIYNCSMEYYYYDRFLWIPFSRSVELTYKYSLLGRDAMLELRCYSDGSYN